MNEYLQRPCVRDMRYYIDHSVFVQCTQESISGRFDRNKVINMQYLMLQMKGSWLTYKPNRNIYLCLTNDTRSPAQCKTKKAHFVCTIE